MEEVKTKRHEAKDRHSRHEKRTKQSLFRGLFGETRRTRRKGGHSYLAGFQVVDEPFEQSEFQFCNKMKDCGHECDGVRGEHTCIPCLHPDCGAENVADQLKREIPATSADECSICCFAILADAPCVRVCNNHVFHAKCVKTLIDNKWNTLRISFAFLDCPACKKPMKIDPSMPILGPLY